MAFLDRVPVCEWPTVRQVLQIQLPRPVPVEYNDSKSGRSDCSARIACGAGLPDVFSINSEKSKSSGYGKK
jgi:hypothetical protein